ncbi:hypothetical protein ACGFH8_10060 [Micromonospora sp. NPDC049175]|uniref:hypothetical protein n=1 Tax=Micromonospora sp. NPDC049175 TaxID=3364266 RepID=UPI003721F74F
MSLTLFSLEHLVCEVPSLGAAPGFRWYELDGDDAGVMRASRERGATPEDGASVVVATRHGAARVIEALPTIGAAAATHVQFEVSGHARDAAALDAVRDHGLTPIPACHLPAAPSRRGHLKDRAERLAALGAPVVKVVYPALNARHVGWAEELLREWPHERVGLSLTPAGHRQGRLRAALAGSRLVFAPLTTTAERMSAYWYRDLVVATGPGSENG